MGGFFQGNWEDEAGNSRWFDMNTFTSFMTRRWNNMEDGRFGREANWSGDKDWEVWEISLFGSWNSATVRITDNQSATRLVLKDQGINLIIEPGASLALRTFMLTDQARLDIHGQLRVADQQTIDGNVYLWPGGSLDNFVDTTIIGEIGRASWRERV